MTLYREFSYWHSSSPVQLKQSMKRSCRILVARASAGSICLDAPTAADCGRILGIESNATRSEVKVAYRKLVLQFHPDVCKSGVNCSAKFIEVNKAYESLIAVAPSRCQSQRNSANSLRSSETSASHMCEAENAPDGALKEDPRVAFLHNLMNGTYIELPEDYSRYYSNLRLYSKASRNKGYKYFQGYM